MALTARESREDAPLTQGLGVPGFATATGRAESSVRWSIRQICRKQGITQHVELVRRVFAVNLGQGSA